MRLHLIATPFRIVCSNLNSSRMEHKNQYSKVVAGDFLNVKLGKTFDVIISHFGPPLIQST
ncbi:MAG: hypothetical protein PHQ98_01505 [Candidatus ainarchaeum sp.]|nr:hypothetical protein [Candidatus ainarchaeum sp.]